jgi:hypothetical protein
VEKVTLTCKYLFGYVLSVESAKRLIGYIDETVEDAKGEKKLKSDSGEKHER